MYDDTTSSDCILKKSTTQTDGNHDNEDLGRQAQRKFHNCAKAR